MWLRLLIPLAFIIGGAGVLFGLTALQGQKLPPWPSWGDGVLMFYVPLVLAVASFTLFAFEQSRFDRVAQGLKRAEVRKIIRSAWGPRYLLIECLAAAGILTVILIFLRLMIAMDDSSKQLSIINSFINSMIMLLAVASVQLNIYWLRFCRRAVEKARGSEGKE